MRATREEYVDLVVQHYFMYEALEEASKALAADPRFAALHPAAIVREQTLVEDLEFLVGENWRDEISPVPATAACRRPLPGDARPSRPGHPGKGSLSDSPLRWAGRW